MSPMARWLGVLAFLLPALGRGQVPWPDFSQQVEISAERMEILRTTQEALFQGEVVIQQGALRMECGSLRIRYDDGGAIVSLKAGGGLRIRSAQGSARADRAEYDKATGDIVLHGAVSFSDGTNRFTAERLRLLQGGKRVVLEQARGRVTLPSATQLPWVAPGKKGGGPR